MKSLMRKCGLAAVVAAMVVSTISAQQPATGLVKGSVRRPGSPVASARVVVDSGSDSTYTATTTTDRDGNFAVSDAPVGGVTVRVYDAADHVIASGKGTLQHAGETITLALQAR